MVLEIDRFNLELNLTPAPLAGRPFAAMASELDQALGIVRGAAAWHGGRVAMVGADLATLALPLDDPRLVVEAADGLLAAELRDTVSGPRGR